MKLNIPLQKSAGIRFNLLYTVLLLVAFVGMLVQMIGLHYYAKYEEAFPYSSKWTVGFRDVLSDDTTTGQPYYYCNNQSYDWVLDSEQIKSQGPMNMSNVGCKFLTTEAMTVVKTDEIQVGTFFLETQVIGNDTVNKHYFVTQPEKITFFMNHGIYHPRAGIISLPKTTMVNERGDVIAQSPTGSFIAISLEDLTAGIDVDAPPVAAGGKRRNLLDVKRADPGYPDETFRMTGVYVLFELSYTNLRPWSLLTEVECVIRAKYLPNVWGAIGTVGSRYFQGYRIIIKTRTALGYADFFTSLTYILSSMVLFGVAQSISVTVYGIVSAVIKKLKQKARGETDEEAQRREELEEAGIAGMETARTIRSAQGAGGTDSDGVFVAGAARGARRVSLNQDNNYPASTPAASTMSIKAPPSRSGAEECIPIDNGGEGHNSTGKYAAFPVNDPRGGNISPPLARSLEISDMVDVSNTDTQPR